MKKTIVSISCIVIAVIANAQTPVFEWAGGTGGTMDDYGHSITIDAFGNIYTTGIFSGTVDFDPGPGIVNLTSTGTNDIFISKVDPAGNFVWAKHVGGSTNENGNSITLDASGNVYVTGYFQGTVDFDPGTGIHNLTSVAGADVFILKLDVSGNFLWANSVGGSSDDIGNSIITDAAGNVYTTGIFLNTVDFDPGAGITNITGAGSNDIFILKLDASGNFMWAKNMGGPSSDVAYSITLDVSGNIYTTGAFIGTSDFDPGAGTFNLTSSATGADIFVSKLDASGNFIWAKNMGGTSYEYGFSIATDSSGNVYTTGNYTGTVDFDPGAGIFNLTSAGLSDIFISKLDASGNFAWAKSMGGTSYDAGNSIAVDASGNIYTTGYFFGTADFDPNAGITNLTSAGLGDVFISKLDNSGNFVSVNQIGGTGDDLGYSIALDGAYTIYTTGYFSGIVDFDPGVGTFNLASVGAEDIFEQKMNQTITTSMATENTAGNTVAIYPNPSNGFFNIVISTPEKNTSIEIYNSIGALVLNKIVNENGPNLIQLVNQADGIYFIKVMSDNKVIASQKIIKE